MNIMKRKRIIVALKHKYNQYMLEREDEIKEQFEGSKEYKRLY